jgi:hypothetical protein
MRHFVVMSASNYLAKSLALYESLREFYGKEFKLYYFCFDNQAFETLRKLDMENIIPISLTEFEDEELLSIKAERSFAEYFYTCTASTILFVLEKYKADMAIYLDSDIYFYDSPEILLREMTDKSVMITEHRYTKTWKKESPGKYCVQFMPFKNNLIGISVLKWWRNECIKWCYLRNENGLWADQGYLNDWPERFEGIHELKHIGGGVAPWNVLQYKFVNPGGNISGIELSTRNRFDLVFYHFQGVRLFDNNYYYLGTPRLPYNAVEIIYFPYLKKLLEISNRISQISSQIEADKIIPFPGNDLYSLARKTKMYLGNRIVTKQMLGVK